MVSLDTGRIWNWWGIKQAAKSICSTNIACTGTPGKHVMKFLLQSEKAAQECDYASSLLTALYLSHKHSPWCEYKHIGWGDAFSGAIKRPCASAYKLSAKSDSTGILCGEEVVWINPPLRVRAVWLLHQPRLLGLLKLIYKASVYSGFPRQGKVNNNGPLDGNKSQPGYMDHTAFFFPSNISWHKGSYPTLTQTPTQFPSIPS